MLDIYPMTQQISFVVCFQLLLFLITAHDVQNDGSISWSRRPTWDLGSFHWECMEPWLLVPHKGRGVTYRVNRMQEQGPVPLLFLVTYLSSHVASGATASSLGILTRMRRGWPCGGAKKSSATVASVSSVMVCAGSSVASEISGSHPGLRAASGLEIPGSRTCRLTPWQTVNASYDFYRATYSSTALLGRGREAYARLDARKLGPYPPRRPAHYRRLGGWPQEAHPAACSGLQGALPSQDSATEQFAGDSSAVALSASNFTWTYLTAAQARRGPVFSFFALRVH